MIYNFTMDFQLEADATNAASNELTPERTPAYHWLVFKGFNILHAVTQH